MQNIIASLCVGSLQSLYRCELVLMFNPALRYPSTNLVFDILSVSGFVQGATGGYFLHGLKEGYRALSIP